MEAPARAATIKTAASEELSVGCDAAGTVSICSVVVLVVESAISTLFCVSKIKEFALREQ
jgi:hypothetical protein